MWADRLFINLIACNIDELESKRRFIVLSSMYTDSGWNNTFFSCRIFLIHCSFMWNCVWLIDEHWFLSIFFCSFQIVAVQYTEKERAPIQAKKLFKKKYVLSEWEFGAITIFFTIKYLIEIWDSPFMTILTWGENWKAEKWNWIGMYSRHRLSQDIIEKAENKSNNDPSHNRHITPFDCFIPFLFS